MERSFRSQGVDVTIRESKDRVELELNGEPIEVAKIDDQYHSQLAHQFRPFDSMDELVDTLLRNEGRFWKLAPPGTAHGTHGETSGKAGRRTSGGRKKKRGGGAGHGGHR